MLVWLPILLLLGFAAPAAAETPPTSPFELLIEALHENGTLDDATFESIRAAARQEVQRSQLAPVGAAPRHASATSPGGPPTDVAAAKLESPQTGVTVALGEDGLEFERDDGAFALTLGGRLHVDAAVFDRRAGTTGSGSQVRRLRAELGARFWEDWSVKAAVDFAGDEVSVKSTYLRYEGIEDTRILIGRFREPFGMERISSSNTTTFMERAAVSTELTPGRRVGFGAQRYGNGWTATAGLFAGDEVEDDVDTVDDGWGTTGRATFTPIREDDRVVHVGGAASYRRYRSSAELRFRERPEARLFPVRSLDTGTLMDLDDEFRVGAELGAVFGPLHFQSEWIGLWLDPKRSDTALLHGAYALASWVLTGESRSYSKKKATFGGVTPEHPFGSEGLGAFELALRWSHLDLSDEEIRGGSQHLVTAGFNWYLNSNLRFMANYINALHVDAAPGAPRSDNSHIFQLRGQVHF